MDIFEREIIRYLAATRFEVSQTLIKVGLRPSEVRAGPYPIFVIPNEVRKLTSAACHRKYTCVDVTKGLDYSLMQNLRTVTMAIETE